MTAIHTSGVTGIACFDGDSSELWAAQAHDDAAQGFAFLRLAVTQASPRVVYVSSNSVAEFLAAVEDSLKECDANSSRASCREVKLETSSLFALEASRARLLSVKVDDISAKQRSAVHELHTCLRLDADAQVRAVGGLIACLQRDGLLSSSLSSLSERSMSDYLTLDDATREALGIFTRDSHPDMLKPGGSAMGKEGLCVASLLDTCITPGGSRMLRSWLKRPLVDLATVNQRLDAVQSLLSRTGDEADCSQHLARALMRVRDVSRTIEHLRLVTSFTPRKEWQGLCDSLAALLHVKDALLDAAASAERPDVQSLFQGLAASVDAAALRSVYDLVASVVDLQGVGDDADVDATAQVDASAAHAIVKHGVDAQLDALKAEYADLPDVLTRGAQAEMRRVQAYYQQQRGAGAGASVRGLTLSLTYIPNVGYCVRIGFISPPDFAPSSAPSVATLLQHLPTDYVFAFTGDAMEQLSDGVEAAGGCIGNFFVCDITRQLDARYGDLFHVILDHESALLTELKKRILGRSPALAAATCTASHADAVLALARAAHEFSLCRPHLTNDNVLCIIGGRHLLQERVVPGAVFIANDTHVDTAAGRCHIISGPNSSGKSVHLKAVALTVFLAHCGCFVPARSARIGLADRIFVRMSTQGTTAQSGGTWLPRESSFVRDVTQVARILRHSTSRSIILLDEFGSGTLSVDGAALLGATVSHLMEPRPPMRAVPPRTFIATHFAPDLMALQREGLLPGEPAVRFMSMTVLTSPAETAENVTFLYKLAPGVCNGSFGVHCARIAGVLPSVVQRAQAIASAAAAGQPIEPLHDDERLQRRAEAYRMMAQALLDTDFTEKEGVEAEQLAHLRAWLRDVCALSSAADDMASDNVEGGNHDAEEEQSMAK